MMEADLELYRRAVEQVTAQRILELAQRYGYRGGLNIFEAAVEMEFGVSL